MLGVYYDFRVLSAFIGSFRSIHLDTTPQSENTFLDLGDKMGEGYLLDLKTP
jgi:hypothetical protein